MESQRTDYVGLFEFKTIYSLNIPHLDGKKN